MYLTLFVLKYFKVNYRQYNHHIIQDLRNNLQNKVRQYNCIIFNKSVLTFLFFFHLLTLRVSIFKTAAFSMILFILSISLTFPIADHKCHPHFFSVPEFLKILLLQCETDI